MMCSTCTCRRSSVRWGKYIPSLRSTRKHFSRDVTEPPPSEVATTADGRGRGRRVRMDLPANGVSDRFFNSPLVVDWRRPRSYISFRSILQFVYFSDTRQKFILIYILYINNIKYLILSLFRITRTQHNRECSFTNIF